jgi:hypothetical protein
MVAGEILERLLEEVMKGTRQRLWPLGRGTPYANLGRLESRFLLQARGGPDRVASPARAGITSRGVAL